MPLLAVKVSGYVPDVPDPGVPLSSPVAGVNVTPLGSAPLLDSVGAGLPFAVTVNEFGLPRKNVALFALVIVGDCEG